MAITLCLPAEQSRWYQQRVQGRLKVEAGEEEIERRSCKAGGGNLFGSSRVRTLRGVFGLLAFLRDRRLPARTLEERDAVLDWNSEV